MSRKRNQLPSQKSPIRNGCLILVVVIILSSQIIGSCLAKEPGLTNLKTNDILFMRRGFNQHWVFETSGEIYSSPTAGNLDESENLEIVFGTSTGRFFCLNSNGELQWSFEANDKIDSSPLIADLNNDGSREILFGSNDGHLYCLSANGQQLWNFSTGHKAGYSSPLAIDLDQDATKEVIMGFWDNTTYCLNANGTTRWSYPVTSIINTKAAAEDIEEDGQIEIIFGTIGGKLYCLSHEGTLKWDFSTEGKIHSIPLIIDIEDDGQQEIVFGSDDNNVYCLDSLGGEKWSYNTSGRIRSSIKGGDIDSDGKKEFVVSSDKNLFCLTSEGKEKWTASTVSHAWTSPVIVELTGDEFTEILIGTAYGGLLLFDLQGKLQGAFEMEAIINTHPFVGDINNDDQLEIIVCTKYHKTFCLTVGSKQVTALGITVIVGSVLGGIIIIVVSLRTIAKKRRKF